MSSVALLWPFGAKLAADGGGPTPLHCGTDGPAYLAAGGASLVVPTCTTTG
jgi:hypothetical protein